MQNLIHISSKVSISKSNLKFKAVRVGGPGGQHVNKVATGIELRYDFSSSILNDKLKEEILKSNDNRISKDGVLIILSSVRRSQEQNKKEAINRLIEFLKPFTKPKKKRIPTKLSRGGKAKRKRSKMKRSDVKKSRKKVVI